MYACVCTNHTLIVFFDLSRYRPLSKRQIVLVSFLENYTYANELSATAPQAMECLFIT